MKIRIPFFIILVTFLLFGFFSLFYVDGAHDGIVFIPALDVLHGKILFKETFTQYGALFTWIHAIGLLIFGEHILTLRLVTLVFYSLTAVVLWEVHKRFLPPSWNLLAFLLWLSLSPVYWWFFHSWSSVQAAFFQCVCMLCYVLYVEKRQLRYLFLTGFVSSLVFWCRQPVGIMNTIAILGIWLLVFPKNMFIRGFFALFGGIIAGFFPVIFWLYGNGAIRDWWLQSIMMQIPFVENTRGLSLDQIPRSLLATRYWRTFYLHWIWIIIPLACVGVFAYSVYKHFRKQVQDTTLLIIVSGIGIASWHQYYPVTERLHFFWAVTPMIGIFVYMLYRLKKQCIVLFYIAVLVNIFWGVHSGWKRINNAGVIAVNPPIFRGVRISKEDKEYHENIVHTLQTYFFMYPQKRYINDAINSFYGLYDRDHFHAFHGIFVDWDILITTIYPDFDYQMRIYIAEERPLIFTRQPEMYPDYCDMNVNPLDAPTVLLVPKEIGKKLQHGWETKAEYLRPFSCQ